MNKNRLLQLTKDIMSGLSEYPEALIPLKKQRGKEGIRYERNQHQFYSGNRDRADGK